MRVMYGGFMEVGTTVVDFKNFKRDLIVFVGEFDAEMAVQFLMSKNKSSKDFSFEFFARDQRALAGLFWADEDMKHIWYDMVFVPFTEIDNHFRNVTLVAALLALETTKSFKWLLESFRKMFVVDPKVVVTNQDAAMKNAIEAVFPNSRDRLCMWHIMKKVSNKTHLGTIMRFIRICRANLQWRLITYHHLKKIMNMTFFQALKKSICGWDRDNDFLVKEGFNNAASDLYKGIMYGTKVESRKLAKQAGKIIPPNKFNYQIMRSFPPRLWHRDLWVQLCESI